MTNEETRRVLEKLEGVHRLAASLLYGSGLRLRECLRLRVKDVDSEGRQIIVRRGKGDKEQVILFPATRRYRVAETGEVRRHHLH
jgi:integrase